MPVTKFPRKLDKSDTELKVDPLESPNYLKTFQIFSIRYKVYVYCINSQRRKDHMNAYFRSVSRSVSYDTDLTIEK